MAFLARQRIQTTPPSVKLDFKWPGSRIGLKLILSILLFSSLVTVLLTGFQLYVEYNRDVQRVEDQIQHIQTSALRSVSRSVWDFNLDALSIQLEDLQQYPDIEYLQVIRDKRPIAQVGVREVEATIEQSLPLTWDRGDRIFELGELKVVATLDNARQRTWQRLWMILTSQAVKTFMVSIFILWMVYWLITSRLLAITAFAKQANFECVDGLESLLRHSGRSIKPADELEMLSTALGEMMRNLQQTHQTLYEAKEQAQVTLTSIGDGVITTDAEGRIKYLNPVAEALTGWENDAIVGQRLDQAIPLLNEITRQPVENPVQRCLTEERTIGLANHTLLVTKDGKEIAIDDSAAPIRQRDGTITGVIMVFHDVTESRKMARQLYHQATHDALTGLINRSEFERRLSNLVAHCNGDHSGEHALLYLDLDQFKLVNDTSGHYAGDELLRQLALLFREQIRERDTLSRIGGDEFTVILEHCSVPRAMDIAEDLREAIQEYRFSWNGKQFRLGVSIGIVAITPPLNYCRTNTAQGGSSLLCSQTSGTQSDPSL